MNQKNLLRYESAKEIINEGDVLLFRANSVAGYLISRYGGGIHSHVALASWRGEPKRSLLECVEFREWKGGRTVSLHTQVAMNDECIDVYRPVSCLEYAIFDAPEGATNGQLAVKYKNQKYNYDTARAVTSTAREMTGNPYGWDIIWELAKHYLPFYRLSNQDVADDAAQRAFVCSTFVSYALRMHFTDVVLNLSDRRTVPADLARSPLLRYLFTLKL